MAHEMLTCPNCGKQFPLSEIAAQQIEDATEERLASERASLKRQFKKDYDKKYRDEFEKQKQEIEAAAIIKAAEAQRTKNLEKDGVINSLRAQIGDLERKANQGSQQLQGEVAELSLESIIRANFPLDQIEPVAPGVRGVDIVQKVRTVAGIECGTIVWESKNTKAWGDKWLSKLKDDQRAIKAEIAVLVSEALPESITHFGNIDGVWVSSYSATVGLATVLRESLIQLAGVRRAAAGKNEKMEALYSYLSGTDFQQRVEAMVDSFIAMQQDLDRERRAMETAWSKREKQIQRIVLSVAGMYGDMQGIIGSTLPRIDRLELPPPSNTTEQ